MSVASRLQSVKCEIASVCSEIGVEPPLLLAVSKTKPWEQLEEAYKAGQRHFGENYAQEIIEKVQKLPGDARFHMIGHLQSNKVVPLLKACPPPHLHLLETVDSAKIADKLQQTLSSLNCGSLNVLIEVNTSGETSKAGVSLTQVGCLATHIQSECPLLSLKGLMTIAHPDPSQARQGMSALKRAAVGLGLSYVSMGMSQDMRVALEEGSTELRIGTAIFGPREPKKEE